VSKFPQIWITDETPARVLIVAGESWVDPDCLVARFEGTEKATWIVQPGGYVCGVGCRARPVNPTPPKPKPVLAARRHEIFNVAR